MTKQANSTYLVIHELNDRVGSLGALSRAIHSSHLDAEPFGSVWVIRTQMPLAQLAHALSPGIAKNDRLLIVECSDHNAWHSMTFETTAWFRQIVANSRYLHPEPVARNAFKNGRA